MALLSSVAYPFITVSIVPPPAPVASRSPGVIAIVGKANAGNVPANAPRQVVTLDDGVTQFASRGAGGAIQPTALFTSIQLAMQQDPVPSKIYGVRVDANDYAAALASLEAVDDVTFVSLAHEYGIDPLLALKNHIESVSANGSRRIGVAMVDPTRGLGGTLSSPPIGPAIPAIPATWVADTLGSLTGAGKVLRSGRMVVVAGRAVNDALAPDFATAAMSAIAGYPPHISPVLKQVRGVSIPKELQFRPVEILQLSEEGIIPIIDPELIPGDGLFLAEGTLFTSDATRPYVDIVRVLDDIEFRLRAGLIGTIGDARITKPGLTLLKSDAEGIIGVLKRQEVIDDFTISIPILDLLGMPASARTPTDDNLINSARASRSVDMTIAVVYGPQIHHLGITLRMTFV
jgi:hypothetical protein